MLLLIPLFGETPIVWDEDQTLYLFMQSFLERPGTASEIFSQRSGVHRERLQRLLQQLLLLCGPGWGVGLRANS